MLVVQLISPLRSRDVQPEIYTSLISINGEFLSLPVEDGVYVDTVPSILFSFSLSVINVHIK